MNQVLLVAAGFAVGWTFVDQVRQYIRYRQRADLIMAVATGIATVLLVYVMTHPR